jgi:alpha-tubulin suppressor-like RCC1 family protein
VLAGGTVDCWGYNGDGVLGDGTTTDSDVPVQVMGITDAIGVATGGNDACALLSGGQVDCWGYNGDGELGDGTYSGPPGACGNGPCSTIPVEVTGITGATEITTGDGQVCELVSDGSGCANYEGGDSCALLGDGDVDCWGYNAEGELGDSTTTESDVPVQVTGIS